jgi:hypothetical protein
MEKDRREATLNGSVILNNAVEATMLIENDLSEIETGLINSFRRVALCHSLNLRSARVWGQMPTHASNPSVRIEIQDRHISLQAEKPALQVSPLQRSLMRESFQESPPTLVSFSQARS